MWAWLYVAFSQDWLHWAPSAFCSTKQIDVLKRNHSKISSQNRILLKLTFHPDCTEKQLAIPISFSLSHIHKVMHVNYKNKKYISHLIRLPIQPLFWEASYYHTDKKYRDLQSLLSPRLCLIRNYVEVIQPLQWLFLVWSQSILRFWILLESLWSNPSFVNSAIMWFL